MTDFRSGLEKLSLEAMVRRSVPDKAVDQDTLRGGVIVTMEFAG